MLVWSRSAYFVFHYKSNLPGLLFLAAMLRLAGIFITGNGRELSKYPALAQEGALIFESESTIPDS